MSKVRNLSLLDLRKTLISALGCRAGQLRVIFCLPEFLGVSTMKRPSPSWWNVKEPLVYVQWFSKFRKEPDSHNQMYIVDWARDAKGEIQGMVVPLTNIRQCCMLSPATKDWDCDWESHTVIDQCKRFFVNNFQSKYSYYTIY